MLKRVKAVPNLLSNRETVLLAIGNSSKLAANFECGTVHKARSRRVAERVVLSGSGGLGPLSHYTPLRRAVALRFALRFSCIAPPSRYPPQRCRTAPLSPVPAGGIASQAALRKVSCYRLYRNYRRTNRGLARNSGLLGERGGVANLHLQARAN